HTLSYYNNTAITQIYTLSLHDALPIYDQHHKNQFFQWRNGHVYKCWEENGEIQQREYSYIHLQKRAFPTPPSSLTKEEAFVISRSEEHTSELQSRENLVCRLLLEKKN